MAGNTSNIGFEKQIWDAACVLRGNIDASEYKSVVLGLIFLKYISDRFEAKYKELVEEGDGFEEDQDEYTAENIFFVPENARWSAIAAAAHTPEIGTVIDDAMRSIEKENKRLKDILPKNFARPELDKRRLGEVVDLFTNIQMIEHGNSKDILGRTYEYCLSKFAEQEGKLAGEFYTPSCVVRTLVEVLQPFNGRVYDPCCGSGGMFVQSAKFIENHGGNINKISVFGQDSNPTTWKMAQMNLAIRGIEADLGKFNADTFFNDCHPQLKADFIMANPPFNLSGWGADKLVDDVRWQYGTPPAGNANFAWLQHILTGKAMIVAYSRPIAMKIYKRILELRPAWTEKVAVVMTQGNNDPEEWREIIGNKAHKDDMARKFKDNNSPLKIAIVVDMWLTGFDVPSLATMYVYKPMAGHNLMQAIARVNRVFKDKEGGLVVDYVGIAAALKQAMNDYTARDKKNYGDTDVSKAAYPKFLEKLSICRDLFHGFSYEKFMTGRDLDRAKLISGGVNFILGKSVAEYELPDHEKTQNVFIKEALLLKQALSLCSSLVDEQTRMEAAFFESVRTMTVRLVSGGTGKKFTLPEVNERINELLKHSIKSEGVINLFSDVQTEFSLFDPKFLEEVANMKEKNLAVELLKKLISEQVSVYRRTNIVKSEKFSEIIQSAMNRYLNGMLTNEEVIQELLKLAKDIAAAAAEGEKLGLTADELAFYDALTKPQAIKDFYQHDELIAITKELTDMLRKNRTIDWQKKESARAGMRRLVKRLLKKHKYPPEGMDDAVQTVMSQCEMWVDNP